MPAAFLTRKDYDELKVLSLFDGISCGMVALERANIPVEKYVAYEIAIKIREKIIQNKGDVTVAILL